MESLTSTECRYSIVMDISSLEKILLSILGGIFALLWIISILLGIFRLISYLLQKIKIINFKKVFIALHQIYIKHKELIEILGCSLFVMVGIPLISIGGSILLISVPISLLICFPILYPLHKWMKNRKTWMNIGFAIFILVIIITSIIVANFMIE